MSQLPQPVPEYDFSRRQIFWAMFAVFTVYGTMSFLIQALNVARPRMAAELNGMPLYAWSVSIPGLVGAFTTLIYGKLSDMYGRRRMLLISVIFSLVGTALSALSTNFIFLIIASAIASLGSGAMMPLVFAVVGDIFPPARRSKWIGLLNIPMGICALFGPTLGGWFVDNLSWRYLFWATIPLLAVCLVTVPIGVPSLVGNAGKRKIDFRGCLLVGIASSTLIIGFSFAGTTYPWGSPRIIGLLAISLVFWILFFVAEGRTEEPILDPEVLGNRSFLTVAVATLFSFFGQMALMMYFPMFLQGVQGISATLSGKIITPYSVLMAFVGVPVGFLLARTKRYKWMYVLGFATLTADMFGIIFFSEKTPILWSVLACTFAGLGLGAIPTVNTMVIQNAVPKRLLGVAMGGIFFAISMGVAISPALLGSVMNASYNKALNHLMPPALKESADEATIASIGDPKVLLSRPAMAALEASFKNGGGHGQELFNQTVQAIRKSMEAGLRSVFLLSAITMLLAFIIICTVPQISWETEASRKKCS